MRSREPLPTRDAGRRGVRGGVVGSVAMEAFESRDG